MSQSQDKVSQFDAAITTAYLKKAWDEEYDRFTRPSTAADAHELERPQLYVSSKNPWTSRPVGISGAKNCSLANGTDLLVELSRQLVTPNHTPSE
ncbi:hypothetical protein IWQ61_007924 [Dispira simplex]|nr:hypothetical protein IWQ61_007924 [Dispira simplex]